MPGYGYICDDKLQPICWGKHGPELLVRVQHTPTRAGATLTCAHTGQPVMFSRGGGGVFTRTQEPAAPIPLAQLLRGGPRFIAETNNALYMLDDMLARGDGQHVRQLVATLESSLDAMHRDTAAYANRLEEKGREAAMWRGKANEASAKLRQAQDRAAIASGRQGTRLNTSFLTPQEIAEQYKSITVVEPTITELVLDGDELHQVTMGKGIAEWLRALFAEAQLHTQRRLADTATAHGLDLHAPCVRRFLQDAFPSWVELNTSAEKLPQDMPDDVFVRLQQVFVACSLSDPPLSLDFEPQLDPHTLKRDAYLDVAPNKKQQRTGVSTLVVPALVKPGAVMMPAKYVWTDGGPCGSSHVGANTPSQPMPEAGKPGPAQTAPELQAKPGRSRGAGETTKRKGKDIHEQCMMQHQRQAPYDAPETCHGFPGDSLEPDASEARDGSVSRVHSAPGQPVHAQGDTAMPRNASEEQQTSPASPSPSNRASSKKKQAQTSPSCSRPDAKHASRVGDTRLRACVHSDTEQSTSARSTAPAVASQNHTGVSTPAATECGPQVESTPQRCSSQTSHPPPSSHGQEVIVQPPSTRSTSMDTHADLQHVEEEQCQADSGFTTLLC